MNRYYLTEAVKSLQRALYKETQKSKRLIREHDEDIKALRKLRESDRILLQSLQNMLKSETEHSNIFFKELVVTQDKLILWRSLTIGLAITWLLSAAVNYYNQQAIQ